MVTVAAVRRFLERFADDDPVYPTTDDDICVYPQGAVCVTLSEKWDDETDRQRLGVFFGDPYDPKTPREWLD